MSAYLFRQSDYVYTGITKSTEVTPSKAVKEKQFAPLLRVRENEKERERSDSREKVF